MKQDTEIRNIHQQIFDQQIEERKYQVSLSY